MFSKLLKKIRDFDTMQSFVIEIAGDLIILALGLVGGYYFKLFLMR